MSSLQSTTKQSSLRLIRNRVIAGLFVVLPIFVTWFVIKWLYDTFDAILIGPISRLLLDIWKIEGANFWMNAVASLAALGLVAGVLFIAGMFFRSRIHRTFDWMLSTVPGVNSVYKAVSNVVEAISQSNTDTEKFKRVVLIEFPHPGMKVPAFVTSECRDTVSNRDILCVYVPTTPIPTSGYMILVPEEDVVAVDWDLQETLQAIVSGGITVPKTVTYSRVPSVEPKVILPKPESKDNKSEMNESGSVIDDPTETQDATS